jgi:hypothetical protein
MSWMPSADPILGDKRSCDALELVVVPRVRDLGDGFAVRRAMPNKKRQMVGPHLLRSSSMSACTQRLTISAILSVLPLGGSKGRLSCAKSRCACSYS